MTRKVGDIVHVEEEAPAVCEMCGKTDELRPYGPNGMRVCFDCAMKDPKEARRQFEALINGEGEKPQ